jgi:amidophosphoribosyltransferase
MGSLKEYCGLFGIYNHKRAAELTYLGLYSLQHRGQESAGIVTSDGSKLHGYRGMGLVSEVFSPESLDSLHGNIAVGHCRYSTTGSSVVTNAQPFQVGCSKGELALAHNGNLINSVKLRHELEGQGAIFQTTMDSEVIVHLIARSRSKDLRQCIEHALRRVRGAYSLLFLSRDSIIAARDPHGIRPLVIGKLDDSYMLASETCALDLLGATYIRDVEPGEIVVIDKNGLTSHKPLKRMKHAYCIFEFIYFARPDSKIFEDSVMLTRKRLGQQLALEHPVLADLVMPIPDSGNEAAVGYAQATGLPFEMGFVRNHYIGRTFIQPTQEIRDFGVKVKLNPVREVVNEKRIVVVEDSIVRGTTGRNRIRALRDAGAKEVHMRISCPPLKHPCFYGIDFPTHTELIAAKKSVEEIGEYLGLDTIGYLSLNGMLRCMKADSRNFCTACFSGHYPTRNVCEGDKYKLEELKK